MKPYERILILGVSLSLISNLFLYQRLGGLENRLGNLQGTQDQVLSTVNAGMNRLTNNLATIEAQGRWVTPIRWEYLRVDPMKGEVTLAFEWQIKESHLEEEVVFNYKGFDEKRFLPVTATAVGRGFYRIEIPVAVKIEPLWHVMVLGDDSRDAMEEEKIRKEENIAAEVKGAGQGLQYYVSRSLEGIAETTDVESLFFEEIGGRVYGHLEVRVNLQAEGNYGISVLGHPGHETRLVIEEATVIRYAGGGETGEEVLVSEILEDEKNGSSPGGSVAFITGPGQGSGGCDALGLRVVYSDGTVFEREIWSEQ